MAHAKASEKAKKTIKNSIKLGHYPSTNSEVDMSGQPLQ
jgi:hypothetical protein